MGKKRKGSRRVQAGTSGDGHGGTPRRKKKRGLNGPSLVFVGLLVFAAIAIAIVSVLDRDRKECPPGQVWSEAHRHCH